MEFSDMRAREKDSLCAVCDSVLVIKWIDDWKLVCSKDLSHEGIENALYPTKKEEV